MNLKVFSYPPCKGEKENKLKIETRTFKIKPRGHNNKTQEARSLPFTSLALGKPQVNKVSYDVYIESHAEMGAHGIPTRYSWFLISLGIPMAIGVGDMVASGRRIQLRKVGVGRGGVEL